MYPLQPRGSGGRDPRIFFVYFNTKSCILVHSLAPKMGSITVYQDPVHWGNEDCWKMLPNEARRPKIEAEGRERGGVLGRWQQAPPARGSGSDVNKTTFLRPKSRPK